MELLSGKNAIITGAGKGIGRAVAIALAKEGVNIGLMARTAADLTAVAAELASYGVKTATATVNVSDIGEVNAAVAKVKAELGAIDILINNAGISSFGSFMEL